MAQDYARRLAKRKKSSRPRRFFIKIIFSLIVLGLIFTLVLTLKVRTKKVPSGASITARALPSDKPSEPHFDFYHLLDRDVATQVTQKPKPINIHTEIKERLQQAIHTQTYQLNIGAYKNASTAQKLCAQWQQQGLPVHSTHLTPQDLYLVWLGPYSSLASAKKQQQILLSKNLKTQLHISKTS